MKCVFCDAELKEGCLFCPKCGKEVQIVPDYNEFDDDYINGLVGNYTEYEDSLREKELKKKAAQKRKAQKIKRENERKKKMILISVISAVVLIIATVVIIIAVIKNGQSNSVEYQVEKAQEAVRKGDTDSAISYYDRALVLDSENLSVMHALADIYLSLNDYDSALAFYKQILSVDSKNKTAIEGIVDIYDKDKDYDAIVELYSSLEDKNEFRDLFEAYLTKEPVFDVSAGKYKDVLKVNITSSDKDIIYYTIDGQNPKDYGIEYEKPLVFEDEGEYEVQAVCVNKYGLYSDVVTKKYTIQFEKPDMPVVSPDGGYYISETYITIKVPKGCSAYYLWGSSDPSTSSTKYKKPFKVIEGNNVLSVIIVNNKTGKCSEIYRGNFEYYAE